VVWVYVLGVCIRKDVFSTPEVVIVEEGTLGGGARLSVLLGESCREKNNKLFDGSLMSFCEESDGCVTSWAKS